MKGQVRIVSYSGEPFADRAEAGRLLADELSELRGRGTVVLGIPRGGVIIAAALARELDADLDVVLARKLKTPGHPELALGAINEEGRVVVDDTLVAELGIPRRYIEQEKVAELAEISRRRDMIRKVLPKVPLEGRVVVVTDDGVATGSTTRVALWSVRQENPARLIGAFPVGPEQTIISLANSADEVVCLRSPSYLYAVGQMYVNFSQVSDDEVIEILADERRRKEQRATARR